MDREEGWTLTEKGIADCWDQVVAARRFIHAYPELSYEEHETTNYLAGLLRSAGIDYQLGPLKTGLVAEIGGDGPLLGLRADIDALQVPELTDLPFRSQHPGKMHACGHDGHAAILLGTALVLKRMESSLPGRVRLIFEPAEEANPSGGRGMIEAGFLDQGAAMEEMYALHLQPELPAGVVGIKSGVMMASSDGIDLLVNGRAGHAATPHLAVDAIAIAAQLITSFQYLRSRRLDPAEPVVLSFGTITGGTLHSVVADRVEIRGTLRCVSPETREKVLGMMEETACLVGQSLGGSVEMGVRPSQPVTRNHPDCAARVERAAEALGGGCLVRLERPWMTAEDFSRFAERIPAAIFWLGAGQGKSPEPLHSSRMVFPEEVMAVGIRMFLGIARDFFAGKVG